MLSPFASVCAADLKGGKVEGQPVPWYVHARCKAHFPGPTAVKCTRYTAVPLKAADNDAVLGIEAPVCSPRTILRYVLIGRRLCKVVVCLIYDLCNGTAV